MTGDPTSTVDERRDPGQLLLQGVTVAALYAVAGFVGSRLFPGPVPLLAPEAGVALAVLLLFGIRYWPVLFATAAVVDLLTGLPLLTAVLTAAGRTAAATFGALLLRSAADFSVRMDRMRDAASFTILGAGASQAVGALVGPPALAWAGLIQSEGLTGVMTAWWLGHAAGVLVVAPLVLAVVGVRDRDGWPRAWPIELAAGLAVAFFLAVALFGGRLSPDLAAAALVLPFPLLLWGAIRFGVHGVSAVLAVVGGIGAWRSATGTGPFAEAALAGGSPGLWVYLLTLGVAAFLMLALVADHRRSLARFKAVFDTSSDGIVIVRDERVVHCNTAALGLFGTRGPERLLETPFRELAPARQPDGSLSDQAFRSRVEEAERQGSARFEWTHQRLNGTSFPAEISLSPVAVEGRPGFLGVIRDMTQRKAHEESLERAREEADAANRAKTEYLSKVSHQIRTALNANLGFARLMERDETLPPKHREHVETVVRSGKHLLELMNDVLERLRVEASRIGFAPTRFDLRALLGDLESTFRVRAEEKGLSLHFDVEPEVPRFTVTDEARLREALLVLLGNAVKFTSEGTVSVRVSRAGKGRPDVTDLAFEVADTGPGIPEDRLDGVFRPAEEAPAFGAPAAAHEAGLPEARDIARLLGGDLTVTSQEGEGSSFRLEIAARPAEEGEEAEARAPRATGLAPGLEAPRVLVVDDTEENRTLLTALLTRVGFEVREAVDGQEAIEIFGTWLPDLVLMDEQMPRMDGSDATRRIKVTEEGRKTPVIMVTAGGFGRDRSEFLEAGADGFVEVPFRESELLGEIERHLDVTYVYGEET